MSAQKSKPVAETAGATVEELLRAAADGLRARGDGDGGDGAALRYIAARIEWCLEQLQKLEAAA